MLSVPLASGQHSSISPSGLFTYSPLSGIAWDLKLSRQLLMDITCHLVKKCRKELWNECPQGGKKVSKFVFPTFLAQVCGLRGKEISTPLVFFAGTAKSSMVPSRVSWHRRSSYVETQSNPTTSEVFQAAIKSSFFPSPCTPPHLPTQSLPVFQLWKTQIRWLSARRPCQPTVPAMTDMAPSVQCGKGEVSLLNGELWGTGPRGGLKGWKHSVQGRMNRQSRCLVLHQGLRACDFPFSCKTWRRSPVLAAFHQPTKA